MSNFTNRVHLPDGNIIYISDDRAGDDRLTDLYMQYGDLKAEVCEKTWGHSLDDAEVVSVGTISSCFEWVAVRLAA